MPKPINPARGTCVCPYKGCNEKCEVKRTKDHERGPRYAVCPVHGTVRATGAKPAAALDSLIESFMGEGAPAPEKKPEPIPQSEAVASKTTGGNIPARDPEPKPAAPPPKVAPAPEPKPKPAGFLGALADALKTF